MRCMLEPRTFAVSPCPHCESSLSNVQGVSVCPDCAYVDRRAGTSRIDG